MHRYVVCFSNRHNKNQERHQEEKLIHSYAEIYWQRKTTHFRLMRRQPKETLKRLDLCGDKTKQTWSEMVPQHLKCCFIPNQSGLKIHFQAIFNQKNSTSQKQSCNGYPSSFPSHISHREYIQYLGNPIAWETCCTCKSPIFTL